MPEPFLILQLRPEDGPADHEFRAILRYGGLSEAQVERVRLVLQPFPEVDLERYAAIIVGGSPFEVSTPEGEKGPEQRAVEEGFRQLLERVVAQDFPFLGCCSGCGLLGSFAGAPVTRKYPEPVGGTTVELTPEGREDPLLQGLPGSFRALVGHKESCEAAPRGAVLLARSEACPVQMFRMGENVYATQFHPEANPEGFVVRIQAYREHGYFPADTADALAEEVRREHTPVAQDILRRFVARYR